MFDIVISLYNKAPFVETTIKSVLAQSYAEWRLFVVDDGSTDGGAELVDGFTDARISLIRQPNQGVGPARNVGIQAGSAEWIAFLDADDVWNADHLQELAALREQFPEAVLIGCAFKRFSGSIAPRQSSLGPHKRRLARYFRESANRRELFVTSSAAIHRSVLATTGDFKPLPGNEDVELWARLALHGLVAVSSRQTLNYRVDTGGITDQGMGERKPSPKPMQRQDLSSTIPTLESALPTIHDPVLRDDIVAYMDSRVGLSLVRAVLKGDMVYARHVRSLYRGRPIGKAHIAAIIARLPDPVARAVVKAGSSLKRTLRK